MVIELAHTFGMETIAEGVETEVRLLGEMGCDKAQGFHFARPLPAEEVPGFLADQPPSGKAFVLPLFTQHRREAVLNIVERRSDK